MGDGIIFRKIGGRIIPIRAASISNALKVSGLNTKPIRNQLASKIVSMRKDLRSPKVGLSSMFSANNPLIDIAKGTKKFLVYHTKDMVPGTKIYKAAGEGGPISMRFQIAKRGLPEMIYSMKKGIK